MRPILPLLALVACRDDALVVFEVDPNVVIREPFEGQQCEEDRAIDFVGTVEDDAPLEDLVVEWVSSKDGVLIGTSPPDADGNVVLTTTLTDGVHVITLRAIDPDNNQGEDTVTIEVLDVPDLPSIEIVHPAVGELGIEDFPFVFMANVSDRQDPPEALTATLSASPGGFLCDLAIDGSGSAACSVALPIAEYLLTFEVADTDDNRVQAQAAYQVVSPDDYDFDGDGYSVNGGDCNDSNDEIYPGAPEVCDGLDNDCSEATGIDVGSECYDDDGDGYCEAPPCMNAAGTIPDCDDTNASISPVAPEVLNGIDDDCDGIVDEGTAAYDDDGDGYCEAPPCVNCTATRADCDDTDYTVNPGETEVCGDDVDNNCDGDLNEEDAIGCVDYYYDGDGDTYGIRGATECWCSDGRYPYTGLDAEDCYDSNPNANPGATDFFNTDRGDGSYDYNCDGSQEREFTDVSPGCAWDTIYISCECGGAGWENRVPSCGGSDNYIDDCSATYDPVCYALCMLSADPITCLLRNCGATCDPVYSSQTQGCR